MKQKAIIIDLDGTLVNSLKIDGFTDAWGKTDWERWMASNRFAPANEWCKEITISMHRRGYRLIFLTARSSGYSGKEITMEWLNLHLNHEGIHDYDLIMRPDGDFRSDADIKYTLYHEIVMPKYDVMLAIDDKLSIVSLWRSLNVPSLHCSDR